MKKKTKHENKLLIKSHHDLNPGEWMPRSDTFKYPGKKIRPTLAQLDGDREAF